MTRMIATPAMACALRPVEGDTQAVRDWRAHLKPGFETPGEAPRKPRPLAPLAIGLGCVGALIAALVVRLG